MNLLKNFIMSKKIKKFTYNNYKNKLFFDESKIRVL